jgi:DNA helicase II / ATP-dependent DNA helicase PcrA
MTQIIFGPPGTGKTTTLLDAVATAMEAGTDPARIGFFSFTRKAAQEAITRARERFGGEAEDYPWFRTLHSAAFRMAGLKSDDVMQTHHYKELGDALGYEFQHNYDETMERAPLHGGLGDRCMALVGLAQATGRPLEETWRLSHVEDVTLGQAVRFDAALREYKRAFRLLDFSDFLNEARGQLDLDMMVIDEAQDLTRQQWSFARRIGAGVPDVLIAGDDDQAIFQWAGADLHFFLSLKGNVKVLPVSHRLPDKVWNRCDAVARSIRVRRAKAWRSRGEGGRVIDLDEPEQAHLLDAETWLLLTRNRYQLDELVRVCRDQGVVYHHAGRWSNEERSVRAVVMYEMLRRGDTVTARQANMAASFIPGMPRVEGHTHTWETMPWPFTGKPDWINTLTAMGLDQREYIRKLRRNGESLTKPGRVTISTIHGVKGGEATNVVVLPDVSRRVHEGMAHDPDQERRVWYVALSRALENLFMVRPRTMRAVDL